jgi:hypothetical protein
MRASISSSRAGVWHFSIQTARLSQVVQPWALAIVRLDFVPSLMPTRWHLADFWHRWLR